MNRTVRPAAERLWAHVVKGDLCWNWTGARTSFGHGVIGLPGKRTGRAHRVSWEMHNGPIPKGMFVLHHCDNPRCVRPDHLFLGTAADNHRDCVSKGRAVKPPVLRGRKNPSAVLTPKMVRKIRGTPRAYGYQQRLSAELGVSTYAIKRVANGDTWRHIA